jgi:ABC-type antimicrobial peptide transport system permease subunit
MTVVGVVADLPREHLTGEADLDLYTSYLQGAPPNVFYVLRTRVPPEAVAAAATRALWSVDPHQSTFDSVSMEDRVERHLWRQRVSASLLLAFGALALLFSAVGIYGVISQAVSQRVREIGVRMTLGASPRRILGMVLGEALTLAGIGAVLGTAGAAALVRTLGHVLYGVSLADPLVYAAVLAILGAVAAGAAALPAWRAARLAPLDAVREAR